MRVHVAALAVGVLLSGCANGPPADEAASRGLVQKTLLDWHRAQAAGDGEAGCRMLTEKRQAGMVKADRELSATIGRVPADSCVGVVANYAQHSDQFRELMRNSRVDSVHLNGERATAIMHTSVVLNGVTRDTPPASLALRWDDGRWLVD